MSNKITIIAAVARNGIIGDRNTLLWHISEDMKHFRRLTSGHPVVMGRKTFDSIGRPLPQRTNVVITRSDRTFAGCLRAGSLEEALGMLDGGDEIFIIGGAQIYASALPVADRMELTIVERDYEGDTSFPEWNRAEWRLVRVERFERGETFDAPFRFETYERIR